MSNNGHDAPPPMGGQPNPNPVPAIDPQLQQAMMAMFQAMTAQFQTVQANAPAQQRPAAPRTRIKTREPDPYDGSDPAKLRAFLSQCKLVFRSRPNDFDDDQVKITYAVSWLKGTAQRWYEPNLSLDDDDLPEYALDWDAFEDALKTTFGEPDPVASATYKLDNLTMKDHHHITKYNVEFNEHATTTGFYERALYAKYYKGLASRIKDGLVYSGRPDTLAELRTQAQALDLRYWERKDEDRFKSNTPSGQTSSKTSSGTYQATSSSYNSSSRQSSQSRTSSRASTPSASTFKAKKPDLSKVLGPDGKLLPEEKERRKKNNLCMICASKDHFSDKCPSRKNQAQARAATLEIVQTSRARAPLPKLSLRIPQTDEVIR
jgi:Ty3 transposon capsid-like protein